jgi:hypothetical protein
LDLTCHPKAQLLKAWVPVGGAIESDRKFRSWSLNGRRDVPVKGILELLPLPLSLLCFVAAMKSFALHILPLSLSCLITGPETIQLSDREQKPLKL